MAQSTRASPRITTRHPAGKRGVNIARRLYEEMRRALLRVIPRHKAGVAFAELPGLVAAQLDRTKFPKPASVCWYVVTVKQDLEARGLIEQVPGTRPQRLRRTPKAAR